MAAFFLVAGGLASIISCYNEWFWLFSRIVVLYSKLSFNIVLQIDLSFCQLADVSILHPKSVYR